MLNSQITFKFTDEKYATRVEVANALGTNLIDPIWNEILKYRNSLKHSLSVLDIAHFPYFITYTNKNVGTINEIKNLIAKFNNEYSSILGGNFSKNLLKKELFRKSLRLIAKKNNILVNDVSLDKVIDNKTFEATHLPIANYYQAIRSLTYENIDETFLANTLAILRNEQELTSFYRFNDIETESSKYLVSREYEAVPAHNIEFLMNNLLSFINDNREPIINKIVATLYMFEYVKPFETFNTEMCMVLIKHISGKEASFLPLECVVQNENIKKYFKEIQKSNDLTYLFNPVAEEIKSIIIESVDKIVQINGHDVKQAYFAGDDKEKFKQEFGFVPNDSVISPKPNIDAEHPKIVEPKPKVPTKDDEIEKRNATIKEEKLLNDKQLKEKATSLLESDPYLKKSQAHFYVRHCTKGKFYTIQQFKKEERCVYETARTSMDNLAKLGYYRREQIKNKFVYTPIER